MTRPIKFKAWDKTRSRMLEVREVTFLVDEGTPMCVSAWEPDAKEKTNAYLITLAPETFTLEQFTGLLDKNGKEIYEGDIVHIRPVPGKRAGDWENWSTNERKPITFDGCTFRFDGMNLAELLGWGGYPSHIEPEVIGNIHENPELLDNTSREAAPSPETKKRRRAA